MWRMHVNASFATHNVACSMYQRTRKALCSGHAGQTAVLVKDKVALRDLTAFRNQLQQLDPTPEEVNCTGELAPSGVHSFTLAWTYFCVSLTACQSFSNQGVHQFAVTEST